MKIKDSNYDAQKRELRTFKARKMHGVQRPQQSHSHTNNIIKSYHATQDSNYSLKLAYGAFAAIVITDYMNGSRDSSAERLNIRRPNESDYSHKRLTHQGVFRVL